ncbi:malto-oligosyltrehalose trehalohydrolase [Devosia pacifica]|uniref:Malto-oligosyltrehalose trehalohydrolase n=1 Tax=Devosia pacifica TaxID=1335967 RepID=A0A918S0R1_9HYPH|nr:malto-oligosyltrehalose trehalohydrolase [Devosia pacifica]GHA18221.1 malto-oligosyltrehalose trehalohydrolase [Devosia pacifica]
MTVTQWGTRRLDDGRMLFRLWGSAGEEISLRINGQDHPARPDADGWFEWTLDTIAPGTHYSFILPDGMEVADPAARAQAGDVHGPSVVVDPDSYVWQNPDWRARPWEETVYYELHIGTFTPEGTFLAAIDKLSHLKQLGINTIEIMPVGQFAGNRGWGYDGVLIYAPHNVYGTPDDLRALIDAAHGLGLNVVLDVIYNHFGPDGNYLSLYAPDFFHPERHTPWGGAIAYERAPVRDFFIDNAIYWLEEFRLDGLRFDAIDHIRDDSEPELLVEAARRIRAKFPDRNIHLTTEDNRNITTLHTRDENGGIPLFSGEWNDDFHNVAHTIATGETEGYYADFAEHHWHMIARSLAQGFAYQGERSKQTGETRGEPSAHLPPTAFVDFIQNHDQVGNRAFGERLVDLAGSGMVRTLMATLLLSPHIPLLFMGEEWGETRPFIFFTDFHGELADAVREGRRKEFAGFGAFHNSAESLKQVPDPNSEASFLASKLDWSRLESESGRDWFDFVQHLLKLRQDRIVPLLAGVGGHVGTVDRAEEGVIAVSWQLSGARLVMMANMSHEPEPTPSAVGEVIYTSSPEALQQLLDETALPGCSIVVALDRGHQELVRT